MKIAIDITQAYKTKTGLKTYADNILKHLRLIDKNNKYYYYRAPRLFQGKYFLVSLINAIIEIIWRQIILPIKIFFNKIDIYYTPGYYSPLIISAKKLVVIHDLIFLNYRQEYNLLSYLYLKYSTHISVRAADIIIATSQYTKEDIQKKYPRISGKKIKVVYAAAEENFKLIDSEEEKKSFRKKYGLEEKYFLYTGGFTLHKNISGLLKIFAEFKISQENFVKEKFKLVMAGPDQVPQKVLQQIKILNIAEDVIFPGYLPLHDLVLLYNCAEIFLFPSLYEGFGMPPLEAMRCGCPVIISDRASLPEVAGDAGVLINPDDYRQYAAGMNKIINNPDYRADLVARGLKRGEKFSWRKSAQQTLDLLESINK